MFCVRGATTVEHNEKEEIIQAVQEMLTQIIDKNQIDKNQIISILFTATRDLDAVYPAAGARNLGLTMASLMCVQEMFVSGSLEKCIRISMYADTDKKQKDAVHVYLNNARMLRPDLTGGKK